MKTKFILHGGFTGTENELNRGFYEELSKDVSNGGTILLIYFSRKDAEVHICFEQDKKKILEQAGDKKLNMELANQKDFLNQVRSADAVYMRGGDTDKLLARLKNFPDFDKAIKGKVVSGSSAGAQVLAKYYYSSSKGGVHEGLGILPVKVVCHYQSKEFEDRGDPIEQLKEYPEDLELVVLKDCEWKTFVI